MSERPDTWMPIFWGDYAKDTGHLSAAHHGAYLMLIKHYWVTGMALPDDDSQLWRIACADSLSHWRKLRTVLEKFFKVGEGVWFHSRIEMEMHSATERKAKAQARAEHAARTRWGKEKQPPSNAPSMPAQCPSPSPSPIEPKGSRASRGSQLPEDWSPTPEELEYAKGQGCIDPSDTAERFRLHHRSKGTIAKDWRASFQYWCRNEKNFARPLAGNRPRDATTPVTRPPDDHEQWTAILRNYKPGGFWSQMWGERPEDIPEGRTPTHIPPPVLAAWRASA